MRRKTWLILLSAWFITNQQAFAWSPSGHQAVAYLAYQKLTPQTRERVNQLLKLNPYYSNWLQRVSPTEDLDTQIFMLASVWCDEIKGDPNFVSDGSGKGNNPDAPGADQNTGYSDHNMHKYWHFCDTPLRTDSTPLPVVPTPNARTKIPEFEKTLASGASDELKSYDLTWLIHLIGDVHQPLHCVTRVSHERPHGDDGGNAVKLDSQNGSHDLHSFWDYLLGRDDKPEVVIAIAKQLPPAEKKLAAKTDCTVWIEESYRLARKRIYVPPIKKGTGPFQVTEKYKEQALRLAKQRVSLAGARLANVLNENLQ
jgi:hypothetical protein